LPQTYPKPATQPKKTPSLEPIPDPEADRTSQPAELSPWLKPGDQTAVRLLPHRWATAKIAWPVRASHNASATRAERPPEPESQAPRRWDDTGWRAVNR
jgi:hypothetical protein